MICELLFASVMLHEGLREKAYLDTVGVVTVGYGTNLERWKIPARFSGSMEITNDCAECWLRMDLEDARTALARNLPWALSLAPARVDALVEMVYNLGITGLLKFRRMLWNLRTGNYHSASDEALDSKWARQVHNRANRIARQLRTGEYWNADECD